MWTSIEENIENLIDKNYPKMGNVLYVLKRLAFLIGFIEDYCTVVHTNEDEIKEAIARNQDVPLDLI